MENGEAWKEQEEAAEAVDSLIKKHPPLLPKRLEERLKTKQLSPPPTISDLSDKLANAELRRNSVSQVDEWRMKIELCWWGLGGCGLR